MMDPLTEVLVGVGAGSAVGIGLNLVLISYQKSNPKHPYFTLVKDADGVGAQLWTYFMSMGAQFFLYCPCVLCAALQWRAAQAAAVAGGGELAAVSWEWKPGGVFPLPGEEESLGVSLLALRVYFYAFCAYLVRDMMMQLREESYRYLMLLHHVVCIFGIHSTC